ncbi:uncharacterized protein MONOS_15130 [Monocercomonoides exilis]|uniref:uncharacterized protein n=1 Tax=Monocercomonoides exilis TaxID=2049356 RepID=UPI0035595216|nr:hypothetical protein MONOS_15130 [Monocercomonoides exilis]
MNEIVEEMNKFGSNLIFGVQIFNKIHEMIEEKKLALENAILLLKYIGYWKGLKNVWNIHFDASSLSGRFEKMIIDKNGKKEEKNDNLLVDLCECYFFLSYNFTSEMLSICVPRLLKAALKKEENDEAQKEVEMALLALRYICVYKFLRQKLYLSELKEIIKYHQEHHNLTQLAYQSAWQFLIFRMNIDGNMEEVIANELHFGREAARELEELTRCVDWKRKKEEERRGKESKEVLIIWRWINTLEEYFDSFKLWNAELVGLLGGILKLFLAAKDNYPDLRDECLITFGRAAKNTAVEIDALVKEGIVDLFFEEMKQFTLDEDIMWNCLNFFLKLSKRLKEEKEDEKKEEERKEAKRKVFKKMEEEGYEDAIASFKEIIDFLQQKYYYSISSDISDYFVNA